MPSLQGWCSYRDWIDVFVDERYESIFIVLLLNLHIMKQKQPTLWIQGTYSWRNLASVATGFEFASQGRHPSQSHNWLSPKPLCSYALRAHHIARDAIPPHWAKCKQVCPYRSRQNCGKNCQRKKSRLKLEGKRLQLCKHMQSTVFEQLTITKSCSALRPGNIGISHTNHIDDASMEDQKRDGEFDVARHKLLQDPLAIGKVWSMLVPRIWT